ncbi:MAG: sugar transferase, partial [Parafilimonas terrae]|nr:sugar transferase [Parafilimonas terrae]
CFAVPPGVTGLWQVSGRSDTTYAERVALDLDYASRWSLTRDIAILVRTVPAVFAQRGSR